MMNIKNKKWIIVFSLIFLLTGKGFSQTIDLKNAQIVSFEKNDKYILKAISVLQEEVKKRSEIQLPVNKKWPKQSANIIAVGVEGQLSKFPEELQKTIAEMPSTEAEGYKITVIEPSKTVLIVGKDARGVLYGIGKLLRKMEIRPGQILVPSDLKIASSPAYPIRGHQLGYRPKTNAYDAFTPEIYDRYIRDLAIFGANSIEIMPPRTDDDFTSVHMKIPAIEMIAEQSRICDSYGLDVWMWYPNMGSDYTHPDSIKKEIEERHEVFKTLPRLDHLFVPGGDPGDLEPDVLFSWMAKEAEVLHEYHPNAKIWVSPQVFRPTKEWFDAFYAHVNKKYPWFGGVVFGPWIKTPIAEIRKIIGPDVPIRRYPDITHSLSCQYPIPKWDLAYAITLGRECINPRPNDQKTIHNAFDELAQGSISYSEGTNDDLNKIVWSDLDWNPETPVIETLRDYARYFISPDFTESVAQGIMALERNLQGPLLANDGVLRTFQQWQALEKEASNDVLKNFRFQEGLIRAYFDYYEFRRLIYETDLEQKAREILGSAKSIGSLKAIEQAIETLHLAKEVPVYPEIRERCYALADSLYNSIRAQLTVEKHHAMDGRGNFIDNIDLPLNDAMWMFDQFESIKELTDETARLKAIEAMLHRTDPGPGGFYDNFGSLGSWDRVISDVSWEKDPGSLLSPRVSFGVGLRGEEWVHQVTARGFEGKSSPMSWMNQVTTLYDQPLEIKYENLDPNSSYIIRVAYTGRFRSKMKMSADGITVHDLIQTGIQPIYEFPVPEKAVADGKVIFQWTCGEGERGSQVSEIWLIKKK
ncbi:MAG: alpha-glucuronidase family glycosyl hydrolase [Draconibacterium sp.]